MQKIAVGAKGRQESVLTINKERMGVNHTHTEVAASMVDVFVLRQSSLSSIFKPSSTSLPAPSKGEKRAATRRPTGWRSSNSEVSR